MNYSEIFSNAWKIVWKFKALWIFGILSSCMRSGGGSSGSGGSSGGGSSLVPGQGNLASPSLDFPGQIIQWFHFLQIKSQEDPWIIAALIVGVFIIITTIVILSIFAGTLGRIGVVRGAWLADEGENKLGFSRIFKESMPYFWRVFALFLLIVFASILLITILVLPIIFITIVTFGLIWIILIPIILPIAFLLIFVSLALRALIEEAIVAIVGEDLGTGQSILRAWKLLIEHPFSQLWISFLISIIEIVIPLVLFLPILFIFIPFLISLLFQTDTAVSIGAGLSGISFLGYLPVIILAIGIMYAYLGSIWTLTFRRLVKKTSKIDTALHVG
ncbi:MAG: hypothetical protein ACYDH1_04840 [Anaerolineaceae bacterium]|jgi:hypothetical protein